nr:transporter substrate-binding domain-containing protein [Sulfitobacter aestuariivivens]
MALCARAALADPIVLPFDPEYPPMSVATDAAPEGFDIVVATEIARELGGEPTFVPSDFNTIQGDGWPDEWAFTVSSTSRSTDREERFHFVGPYYFAAVVLVKLASDAATVDPDDPFNLPAGARIGVCDGCIYKAFVEGNYLSDGEDVDPPLGDVEVLTYAFETDVLRALVGDTDQPVDYAITSAAFAQHFRNLGFPLEQVGPPLFVEPLWITQPLRAPTTERAALEEAFRRVAGAGTISQASRDFLGGDFSAPVD